MRCDCVFDRLDNIHGVQCIGQVPADDHATVPVDDGRQVHVSMIHADICDVDGPNLVREADRLVSQPVRNDGLLEVTQGQVLFGADGTNPHFAHQTAYELPSGVDMIDLLKLGGEPSGTQIRHPGMPVVNPGHDMLFPQTFFFISWDGLIVKRRSGDSQKLTLTPDRQLTVFSDQFVGLVFQFGESNPGESHVPE